MSRQEALERAPFFHREMGWNPDNFTYTVKVTPTGYAIIAHDNKSEAEYPVAFYSHRTGRLVGAN